MTRKCFVADLRKAALHAKRDTGTVKQDGGLEALAHQARGLQHIDEPDRALKGDGVKRDQRFFAGFRFHIFENLLFVIDEIVAFLAGWHCYGWHVPLLVIVPGVGRARRKLCNGCAS